MKRIVFLVVLAVAVLLPAFAVSAPSELPAQLIDVRSETCPVMGGKPKAEVAAIHEGKIYHFCCPSCIEEFRKNPAVAIAKLKNPTEVVVRQTNTKGTCPVSGSRAKVDLFLVRGDTVTFYCCKGCVGNDSPASATGSSPSPGSVPATETTSGASCSPDGVCK